MSRIFDSNGSHIPVTVLHLDNCHVISSMTEEKNGYSAVQIGVGKIKDKKLSKSMKGHFKKNFFCGDIGSVDASREYPQQGRDNVPNR